MAQLPDALPDPDVSGVRTPTNVVPIGDVLNLGKASQVVSEVGAINRQTQEINTRAQEQQDAIAIQPQLQALQEANSQDLVDKAANYDGKPGFATARYAEGQQRAADAAAAEGLTPGQAAQLRKAGAEEAARHGQQAIEFERSRQLQQAGDLQQVKANGYTGNLITNYGQVRHDLVENWKPADGGISKPALAAFDREAEAQIAAAPDNLKPGLQATFSAMRVKEQADLLRIEGEGVDAHILQSAADQAMGQINGINTAPTNYDTVVSQGLPAIAATLPAGHREGFLREMGVAAVNAKIEGLIAGGNAQQAKSELDDGRYDKVLTKEGLKAHLEDRVDAALRAKGPNSIDQGIATAQAQDALKADTYSVLTTGEGLNLDLAKMAQILGGEAVGRHVVDIGNARRAFAAVGAMRDLSGAELSALRSAPPPAPDPTDAEGSAQRLQTYTATQAAADEEAKLRASPGAWAWQSKSTKGAAATTASGVAQERGAALQQAWQDTLAGKPHAAGTYAGSMIKAQFGQVPQAQWQIVPDQVAKDLAAGVTGAAPADKMAAIGDLHTLINRLPGGIALPNHTTWDARQTMIDQLQKAGMDAKTMVAVLDYGDNRVKLGNVLAATNDPTLNKDVAARDRTLVAQMVQKGMAPLLNSISPLRGAEPLAQARIDVATDVAVGFMAHQGMGQAQAAQAAVAQVAGGYRFVDTYRIPSDVANVQHFSSQQLVASGAMQVRTGAALYTGVMTGQGGANLFVPAGEHPDTYAQKVKNNAKWVTLPDDSGLVLMMPSEDMTWSPAADKWGHQITATWSQLTGYARPGTPPLPPKPPPETLRTPATAAAPGVPVPAFTKQQGFDALAYGVEQQESHFRDNLTSPAGALGRMQIMPDKEGKKGTGHIYADQLGLVWDENRALHDNAYNRQIGRAALAGEVNHFGPGAGIGLAAAAYNAGRGRLEGYRDPKTNQWVPGWLTTIGDPRKGQISLDDFVRRIPFKETREYVQAVLPNALNHLQTQRAH